MKRFLIISGILLVVLIVVVMIVKGDGSKAIRVATEKASRRSITELVSASGKVQPEQEVKITSDVSGQIVELLVKEGDTVKKGQLLLRINPNVYESAVERMQAMVNGARANLATSQARLAQSKAQLANTELAYNRNKKLHDQKAISDAEYETAKAQYESAKADVQAASESARSADFNVSSSAASLKEANENLTRTSIYAPVSGTISKLAKRKGESVLGNAQMAGEVILTIANLLEMEVQVDVNENDILRVHLNDTALIEVEAHDNRKFKGIVTEVANSATSTGLNTDQVTNFSVKVRILRESYKDLMKTERPNEYPFLPGMSATVDIQTRSVQNAIAVPIQSVTTRTDTAAKTGTGEDLAKGSDAGGPPPALQTGDKREAKTETPEPIECVFVLRDGKVKLIAVKTGVQDNQYIEIVSGLKEGDEVVSAPFSAIRTKLYNGASVEKVSKDDLVADTE
ncbi:MAG: efflux RND transporter periplasmic adaptor subunit [Bacteroidia bacterium]|jgi:HlyD family secretion protein|nr:efflux RND transporter periplasmic adaptor subunit [Bacteroidia bacterium]